MTLIEITRLTRDMLILRPQPSMIERKFALFNHMNKGRYTACLYIENARERSCTTGTSNENEVQVL